MAEPGPIAQAAVVRWLLYSTLLCVLGLQPACDASDPQARRADAGAREPADAGSSGDAGNDDASRSDLGAPDPFRPDAGSSPDAGPPPDGGARADAQSATEDSDSTCSDGVDNDEDGFVDCDDYDCSRNRSITVCGREDEDTLCTDGLDNDGDGFLDCDDYDCSRNPSVSVCGGGFPSGIGWSVAECNGAGRAELIGLGSTSGQSWEGPAVWISNSSANTVLGYTKDAITSGPFPNPGQIGEFQIRLEFGLGRPQAGATYAAVLGVFRWDGQQWTTVDGSTSATVTIRHVSISDADYESGAWCAGVLVADAEARLYTGVDVLTFSFAAPLLGPGFPR